MANGMAPLDSVYATILEIEDYWLAHDGREVFTNLLMLVRLKWFWESTEGNIHFETQSIRDIQDKVSLNNPNEISVLFDFHITEGNTKYAIKRLSKIKLREVGEDVWGLLFECLSFAQSKGEKGQYFTPTTVTKFVAHCLDLPPGAKILDPACGSGGFLISFGRFAKANELVYDLHGWDYDPSAVKVARWQSELEDVGMNVDCKNSLDLEDVGEDFDCIVTNPPFSGKIEIVNQISTILSGTSFSKQKISSKPNLFFIQCLKLLKPNGLLVIVLPRGVLNNSNSKNFRASALEEADLIASISLHNNSFKPFTVPQTDLVILRKKNGEFGESEKSLFAIMESCGKDGRGYTNWREQEDNEPAYSVTMRHGENTMVVNTDWSELFVALQSQLRRGI